MRNQSRSYATPPPRSATALDRAARSISPAGADKLYAKIVINKDDERRDRAAEKVVGLYRKAWRVVHRLHPEHFDKAVPNPWTGVTLKVKAKAK